MNISSTSQNSSQFKHILKTFFRKPYFSHLSSSGRHMDESQWLIPAKRMFNKNDKESAMERFIKFLVVISMTLFTHTALAAAVSYESFEKDNYTRYSFEGEHVVLLLDHPMYNSNVINAILDDLDSAYEIYTRVTGREPTLFREYNGKGSIAVVDSTCGAGCGYVGYTGIEILKDWWDTLYNYHNNDGLRQQILFYELGRNFTFISGKTHTADLSTPFAVFMSIYITDELGLPLAPIRTGSGDTFTVAGFIDAFQELFSTYLSSNSYTFNSVFINNQGVSNTYGLNGGGDVITGMYFNLWEAYGDNWVENFFKDLAARPNADTTQETADNIVLSASSAASRDLSSVFIDWKFPAVSVNPIDANFETELGWTNDGTYNWSRDSGGTPSGNTGPSSGSNSTYYAYFETSSGHAHASGNTATLRSDHFVPAGKTVTFDYHMFGADIGTLSLEIGTPGGWSSLWSVSGQQQSSHGAAWKTQTVTLPNYTFISSIRFKAVAAGGYRGDIAIDNILIMESDGSFTQVIADQDNVASGHFCGWSAPTISGSRSSQKLYCYMGSQQVATVTYNTVPSGGFYDPVFQINRANYELRNFNRNTFDYQIVEVFDAGANALAPNLQPRDNLPPVAATSAPTTVALAQNAPLHSSLPASSSRSTHSSCRWKTLGDTVGIANYQLECKGTVYATLRRYHQGNIVNEKIACDVSSNVSGVTGTGRFGVNGGVCNFSLRGRL